MSKIIQGVLLVVVFSLVVTSISLGGYLAYTWVDYYYGFDINCWWNDWDCKTIVYTSEYPLDDKYIVNIGTTKCQKFSEENSKVKMVYAQGSVLGYEAEQTVNRLISEGWDCR